ncbi:hypothetical protein TWF281_001671 [Arthrobotrys megalospora]
MECDILCRVDVFEALSRSRLGRTAEKAVDYGTLKAAASSSRGLGPLLCKVWTSQYFYTEGASDQGARRLTLVIAKNRRKPLPPVKRDEARNGTETEEEMLTPIKCRFVI